jgi:uncharacterized protein
MKLVSLSKLKKTPWKNGLGLTSEIAIEPKTSKFPADSFFWRISCAEVTGQNQFSQFLGYERWLVVWKGDGLILNGQKLLPFETFRFDGNEKINCELIESSVLDLGVIFKKGQVRCRMEVLCGNAQETIKLKSDDTTRRFLFFAEGSGVAEGQKISEEDILDLEDSATFELVYLSKSRCVLIEIEMI